MKGLLETWRPVRGYEGLYEVSDFGDVRSFYQGKVRYMKNMKNNKGYEYLKLCRDGKSRHYRVHRLVWEAFRGPIPDGMQIDHINTVRDDNRLVNLRAVTPKENQNNPLTAERNRDAGKRRSKDQKWLKRNLEAARKRSKNPEWIENHREASRKAHAKPVLQLDKKTGEVIHEWECARDAEREFGISNHISECCLGKRKSAGGFRWRFK